MYPTDVLWRMLGSEKAFEVHLQARCHLLLARGLDVVDTANGGEEALEKASRLLPDVVLMDIFMKPLSGLQTTRLIKVKLPQIKIIMLTAAETDEELFEAVKSGASGYLLKSQGNAAGSPGNTI